MSTTSEIAKMIDHSLLHPTMTDSTLKEGCDLAYKYNVASVCVKPYAVPDAVTWLLDSEVAVGTVIGFPHGNSSIAIKVKETEQALAEGATEIDMVVNVGKVLSGQWNYVKDEMFSILEPVRKYKGLLKVIFENDYLPNDEVKIALCEICNELKVDFAKTSTGYGFVKGSDGKYSYEGATEHDLKLMRKHCHPEVQIKAAGGVRTLADALKVREWGVTRIGASATAAILDGAVQELGPYDNY